MHNNKLLSRFLSFIASPEVKIMGPAFLSINLFISMAHYYMAVTPALGLIPFLIYMGSIALVLTKGFPSCQDKMLFSHMYVTLPFVIPLLLPFPSGIFVYIFCLVVFFFNALICHAEIIKQRSLFSSWQHAGVMVMLGIALGTITGGVAVQLVADKMLPFLLSVIGVCLLKSPLPKLPELPMGTFKVSSPSLLDFLDISESTRKKISKEKETIIASYPFLKKIIIRYRQYRLKFHQLKSQKSKLAVPFFLNKPLSATNDGIAFLCYALLLLGMGNLYRLLVPLAANGESLILMGYAIAYVGFAILICFRFRYRSMFFGLSITAVMLTNLLITKATLPSMGHIAISGIELTVEILMLVSSILLCLSVKSPVLLQVTSPYGKLCVMHNRLNDTLQLLNDDVIHGSQRRDEKHRAEPISYYMQQGPVGQLFSALQGDERGNHISVIGLGVGTIAAYGRAGQQITFYEIDPAVEKIACHTDYFTYIRDSAADIKVVVGDARETLTTVEDKSIGVLICDAYSGNAIPKHLLTREAMQMYLQKIEEHGLLVIDITNSLVKLKPIVAKLATDMGLIALVRDYYPSKENKQKKDTSSIKGLIPGKKSLLTPQTDPVVANSIQTLYGFLGAVGLIPVDINTSHSCRWVVLARRREDLALLLHDARWSLLHADNNTPLWTDEFIGYMPLTTEEAIEV